MTWKRDTEVDCDGTGNAHELNMYSSDSRMRDGYLDSKGPSHHDEKDEGKHG